MIYGGEINPRADSSRGWKVKLEEIDWGGGICFTARRRLFPANGCLMMGFRYAAPPAALRQPEPAADSPAFLTRLSERDSLAGGLPFISKLGLVQLWLISSIPW